MAVPGHIRDTSTPVSSSLAQGRWPQKEEDTDVASRQLYFLSIWYLRSGNSISYTLVYCGGRIGTGVGHPEEL